MNAKLLIPLFALVMAIGWFLPETGALPTPTNGPHKATSSQNDAYGEDGYSSEADDGDEDGSVTLDRHADGHFYAEVDINGETVDFLVDTGATSIALTGSDAEALGIEWDSGNLQKVGRGASGDVYGKLVTLDEVQLGPFTARDVKAAVIPEGLDKSLLGQAFLRQIDNVNISGDQMVLQ